jgi:antitoxin component of MazEF toxin-antitoxin module
MVVVRKVRRVGNSLMVPLPPETLRESGLIEGMDVAISSELGRVELRPADLPAADLIEFAQRFVKRYREDLQSLADA